MASGATSTGGPALVASKLRGKTGAQKNQPANRGEENTVDRLNIVSRSEWLAARKELLKREKEITRERDALSAQRRKLPIIEIEKEYVFEGPDGPANLRDLFGQHRQLIVYHFMFDPSWDEGCKSCSLFADNFTGSIVHLAARDTSFVAVSRAPLSKIEPFKRRMGWTFPWLSSVGNNFNYDFHVTLDEAEGSTEYNYQSAATLLKQGKIWQLGELPGLSVFLRDGDRVFHTYSTYQRGLDLFLNTYNYLDLTPLGRQEDQEPHIMAWVRHHDKY
jgi:predicted dithiol-disulfide oxidoreductase (DUF899 family)